MLKATHAAPDLALINWLNRQDASRIVVAKLSIAEISYALDCLVADSAAGETSGPCVRTNGHGA